MVPTLEIFYLKQRLQRRACHNYFHINVFRSFNTFIISYNLHCSDLHKFQVVNGIVNGLQNLCSLFYEEVLKSKCVKKKPSHTKIGSAPRLYLKTFLKVKPSARFVILVRLRSFTVERCFFSVLNNLVTTKCFVEKVSDQTIWAQASPHVWVQVQFLVRRHVVQYRDTKHFL